MRDCLSRVRPQCTPGLRGTPAGLLSRRAPRVPCRTWEAAAGLGASHRKPTPTQETRGRTKRRVCSYMRL